MELLSMRGHKIMVIGFDQLWRESNDGIFSKRIVVHHVKRFYENADITYIRPFFIRFPVFDFISFLFSSRKEIKKQIRAFNPDIIIGFSSLLSNYWGLKYALKNNVPYIYYWYDIVHKLNVPRQFELIAIMIEKRIIKKSTRILTINKGLKDYLVEFGSNPLITEVIPGGIDFDKFDLSKVDLHKIREKYHISENDLVLFFMGWIYEFSGLKEIVEEISKYKDERPYLKLLIVGKGDDYSNLKKLVKEKDIGDKVVLTGLQPYEKIPSFLALADICILPAYCNDIMRDIVPIKMYEYMASSCPVIITRLPGIMKEFGEGNGIFYMDNPREVFRKAIELYDKGKICEEGKKAFENVKENDWTTIVNKFENILKELIKS